ncbi:MAG: hypothetical protein WC477_03340 [Patescibacteria group bacterium]
MANWKRICFALFLGIVTVACNMADGSKFEDIRTIGGSAPIATGGSVSTGGNSAATGGTTVQQVTCINDAGNKVGVGIVQGCTCDTTSDGTQSCQSDGTWSTCDHCASTGICTPGSTPECACSSGASGTKTCKSDGSGYDPCVCVTHTCLDKGGVAVGVGSTQDCSCGASMSGGSQSCLSNGDWGVCTGCTSNSTGGASSVAVTCSGKNGKVSPGANQTCDCGSGSTGTQTCQASGSWSTCTSCSSIGTGGSAPQQTTCVSNNVTYGVGAAVSCSCGSGSEGMQTCQSNGAWSTCGSCSSVNSGTGGSGTQPPVTCIANNTTYGVGAAVSCSCGSGSVGSQSCLSNGQWSSCGSCSSVGVGGSTSNPPTTCIANNTTYGVGVVLSCSCGSNSTGVQSCQSNGQWSSCGSCSNVNNGTGGSGGTNTPMCITTNGTPVTVSSVQTCSCGSNGSGIQVCQSNTQWSACGSCTNTNTDTGSTSNVTVSCTLPYSAVVITTIYQGWWDGQVWTNICDMNMNQIGITNDTYSCSFKVPHGKTVFMNDDTNFQASQHLADGSVLVNLKSGSSVPLPSGAADQWMAYEATGIQAQNMNPAHGVYADTVANTLRCNVRSECFVIFGACNVTFNNGAPIPLGLGNVVANGGNVGANLSFVVP